MKSETLISQTCATIVYLYKYLAIDELILYERFAVKRRQLWYTERSSYNKTIPYNAFSELIKISVILLIRVLKKPDPCMLIVSRLLLLFGKKHENVCIAIKVSYGDLFEIEGERE